MNDDDRAGITGGGPGDDRLDELLRDAAQNYNRPPAAPRELMWSRIEARRRDAGRGTRDAAAAGVIPLYPRTQRHWLRWGVGIAAALALGFGLGRWDGGSRPGTGRPDSTGVPGAAVATRTPAATPVAAAGAGPADSATTQDSVREPITPSDQRVASAGTPHDTRRALDRQPGAGPTATNCGAPSAECTRPPAAGPRPSAAYTLAAIQHLTQAEALLTSFRAGARSGKEMDAQLSAWAKDLLVSTRLMLDSPAGQDARMRRLLEDLELVLAQIAQLSGQRAGDERTLIDEAVEGRNVLPRLRTTIPAGARPVGS